MFCILLITDVLFVIESANLHQRQIWNKSDPGFEFGFSDKSGSGCPSYPSQNCRCFISSASVISPSMIQIGCWLYENWENRENANKCLKIAYSSVVNKMKVIRNPRADPDHHQMSITSRRSPLGRACQVWSTSVSAFVTYPVYRMTERMKEWQRTIT